MMHSKSHRFRCLRLCVIFSLTIWSLGPAHSGGAYFTDQSEAIRQAKEIISQHVQEVGIPGVTAAVSSKGRIVWAEGFGLSDVENRVPVWPHTKMRIGSVSKSLTSVALGILYEMGKLNPDAPVQRYVPAYPEKRWPISTRQVAGHIAGVRHYRGEEFLISRHYDTVLEGLNIFKDDTLLFKPGEKFSYSSYGWNLLSAVIEGASGQDFLTFMEEQVFEPLEMRNTLPELMDAIIYNRTRYYIKNEAGELLNAPFVDNSYKWAGGGFISTAEDVALFGNGVISGTMLKAETLELLLTPLQTSSGESTSYGLGWRIWEEGGQRLVGHTGGSVGGSSVLIISPEKEVVIALICNLTDGRLLEPGRAILRLFSE